jgi:hypothetical protein
MAEPASFALDTYALLAYLQGEQSASRIEQRLEVAAKVKSRMFA